MQNIFLFLLFLVIQCSSVQYVKKNPTLKDDISSTKRIAIVSAKDSNISKNEYFMLHDMLRQEISHHTLFIVYKAPTKFKNICSKEFPKVEGVLIAEMKEYSEASKSKFELKAALRKCSTDSTIWSAKVADKFSLEANKELSLVKGYVGKYGDSVANKVNAFFQLSKDLVSELQGPEKLSEEEELEKIEVESE
ncbi:MAG TPA: MXAN_6521/LA_1396 family lipoprotein [Leptospiraceae bacterium]|nr:MXAN_6521/LA_1396 family lipoprotein [Leptospiraceae bacterium]HMW08173.1 MXAN_6521/LA_1396 family lipoprotein [Leptospiraceae bacterium]HMX35262.1 MXAN_6521/LA_1396 family lipoprotein [Leptospiraceae bacterium]HMY33976.1 MXAN_6521/LA_1396 family lipoprotein [Leptospiraceae bacterium]HMZ67647.1 MXAN_6521/LA_1396 family lipoprotein [Leptospiraceae bacterium]